MNTNPPLIFAPDPDGLLRTLSSKIDDSMLIEIAEADYQNEAAEHLQALRQIRDQGHVTQPNAWVPGEVLELIRWSEPEDPAWKPGATGERGHWMRAFSCACLLRSVGEHDLGYRLSVPDTTIQLVGSLKTLPFEDWSKTGSFLTWFLCKLHEDAYFEGRACIAVALLWCALRAGGTSDAEIVTLCEWLAACAKDEIALSAWTEAFLPVDGLKADAWKTLGADLARLELAERSGSAREWVRLIGTSLRDQ